ncbi:protein DOWN-REGULATED IN DIF1 11-like [Castanea sativa]|uniref:protein DOWN-REGULATED IN DIF1 11-like n=1 Tax=Castanea sativa TaxID=21020 RepID=UPI003F652553
MARFTSFPAVVVVVLLASAIGVLLPKVASDIFEESVALPPEYDGSYVEERPGFIEDGEYEANFLDNCKKKLTYNCGTSIFTTIFLKDEVITQDCCHQLVKIGLACHNGLVKHVISIPEFKANQSITLRRGVKIWNKCKLVTGSFSTSHSP